MPVWKNNSNRMGKIISLEQVLSVSQPANIRNRINRCDVIVPGNKGRVTTRQVPPPLSNSQTQTRQTQTEEQHGPKHDDSASQAKKGDRPGGCAVAGLQTYPSGNDAELRWNCSRARGRGRKLCLQTRGHRNNTGERPAATGMVSC